MAETIGVLGATGALGKEIITALEAAPYRPDTVVPLARAHTRTPFVTYQEREVAVDDVSFENLERLDLLFLACPPEVAVEWGTKAIQAGVPVVDCSGALASEAVPLGVPWVNPGVVANAGMQVVSMPSPEAVLASSVLGPLAAAGLGGDAEAVFLVPASRFGRDAIVELSEQVVALFNTGTPARKIFPDGLAFDLLPTATETPAPYTAGEQRVAREVEAVTGIRFHATRIAVPVFSGLSMELRVEPQRRPVVELVRQILADGGLQVEDTGVRTLPRPRRVEGQPFAHAGRIRIDERGEVMRIWASMDNLRASAVVAVGLGGLLLGSR